MEEAAAADDFTFIPGPSARKAADAPSIVCAICWYDFPIRAGLLRHQAEAHVEADFKRGTCARAFGPQCALRGHCAALGHRLSNRFRLACE